MTKTKTRNTIYLRMDARAPAKAAGMALAHNNVLHDRTTAIGFNGFRAFSALIAPIRTCRTSSRARAARAMISARTMRKRITSRLDSPRSGTNRYREFAANLPEWMRENEAPVVT